MDSNLELALVASAVFVIQKMKKGKSRKKRALWSRNWLLRRKQLGVCDNLLVELAEEDPRSFKNWMRMDKRGFDVLLEKVGPLIYKQDTKFRECIPAKDRLAMTLRYLATG